ncbi:hypothetical protein [Kineococcus sp. SYSU DK006]|uniref:hypothetical protein n=1 Tax=Kineococcus sp. SYSU DK006 TaxID=3383127 RepID=UPI003D7DC5AC
MSRALCVIARAATVAVRLAPGRGDRRLFLPWAAQVPLAAEFDSLTFWMADDYAARPQSAGLAPALAAPGWNRLSSVDPELSGRQVVPTTLDQVPAGRMSLEPALLKLVQAPAGVGEVADFRRAALAGGAMRGCRCSTAGNCWSWTTSTASWSARAGCSPAARTGVGFGAVQLRSGGVRGGGGARQHRESGAVGHDEAGGYVEFGT